MAEAITIYKGTPGLNTVADPVSVNFDPETALVDLIVAINVVVNPDFKIARRKGRTLLSAGIYHSIFCNRREAYVVSGTTMYRIGTNNSLTAIATGLHEGRWVDYVQQGNKIYFMSPYDRGVIENGIASAWIAEEYFGPTTSKQFINSLYGDHLEIHSGRMLISSGPVMWYSEPFRFSLFDMANSHITLDSDIRMIKSVRNGVYVSTDYAVYFLAGLNPKEWQAVLVTDYPALEWSVSTSLIEGTDIGLQSPGLCAVWVSPEGVVVGTPDGMVYNVNKKRVVYPEDVSIGASVLIGYNFLHRMV